MDKDGSLRRIVRGSVTRVLLASALFAMGSAAVYAAFLPWRHSPTINAVTFLVRWGTYTPLGPSSCSDVPVLLESPCGLFWSIVALQGVALIVGAASSVPALIGSGRPALLGGIAGLVVASLHAMTSGLWTADPIQTPHWVFASTNLTRPEVPTSWTLAALLSLWVAPVVAGGLAGLVAGRLGRRTIRQPNAGDPARLVPTAD